MIPSFSFRASHRHPDASEESQISDDVSDVKTGNKTTFNPTRFVHTWDEPAGREKRMHSRLSFKRRLAARSNTSLRVARLSSALAYVCLFSNISEMAANESQLCFFFFFFGSGSTSSVLDKWNCSWWDLKPVPQNQSKPRESRL